MADSRQFNFTRCLIGAAFVGTVQIINREIGAGWMFVLLSGICLLVTPLPLIVIRYGPRWRAQRAERAERKGAVELAQRVPPSGSVASEGRKV
jgi:hypothetical protein